MELELVIEYGEDSRAGYGSIHRKGCSDVRDPAPIGAANTQAEAVILADQATYWAHNNGEDPADYGYTVAPCVTLPAS